MERAVDILERSNFQCWPEAGGWAVQDDLLVQDVLTWLALERRMEWEAENGFSDDADIVPSDARRFRMDQLG